MNFLAGMLFGATCIFAASLYLDEPPVEPAFIMRCTLTTPAQPATLGQPADGGSGITVYLDRSSRLLVHDSRIRIVDESGQLTERRGADLECGE